MPCRTGTGCRTGKRVVCLSDSVGMRVGTRRATSVCRPRHVRMGQGPTEPHTGRSTFLPSSGGAGGGYYRVAFGAGPIATENQFPCRTLVACLVGTSGCTRCVDWEETISIVCPRSTGEKHFWVRESGAVVLLMLPLRLGVPPHTSAGNAHAQSPPRPSTLGGAHRT